MKSVIVGTAGHIDHGKTALVKALTGIDADRLAEEKERGITIDIGFAHLELPGPGGERLRLGFVDVPGHERFVRNMLAGVGGIDLVLLVIGADEGVKPQTIEHFDICRLLNIPRGMTVLTKTDLVDEETLAVVRMEVEEYLRGSFLDTARSPLVTVSSRTGAGLDELKRELARLAAEAPAKDSGALLRLPVDRVFTMKGFGTVVTGTLVSGAVRKEQELEVFPSGKRVRVRGIQVHNSAAENAVAGERTALNLAGVTTDELARGMTLAEPGVFHTTSRADVLLSLLPVARPLRDRARVHFHSYAAETIAEVVLLADARAAHDPNRTAPLRHLLPGAEAFAQLRLADPLLLLPGDRFILRQFSPVVTLGGGVVIDASPPARKKVPREAWLMSLSSLATGAPGQKLSQRVARRGAAGLTMAQAVAETGWPRPVIESILPEYTRALSRLGEVLVANAVVMRLRSEAVQVIERFQAANPLLPGIGKEELRAQLGAADQVFASVLDAVVREKKVEVAGEVVRAAGRGVVMKDEEAESKQAIEEAFATAGLKVPALKEVLAGLKVDRTRAQQIVTLLLRDKVLVKLSDDLVFHRAALEDLRRRLAEQKSKSARIDVGQFKDLFGVSRKYAIPLLEYLDRERVTRRVGDVREIL